MNEVSLNSVLNDECAYQADVMWCRETDEGLPSGGAVERKREDVKQHDAATIMARTRTLALCEVVLKLFASLLFFGLESTASASHA